MFVCEPEKRPVIFGKLSARYEPTPPRLPLPCGILSLKLGKLKVSLNFEVYGLKILNLFLIITQIRSL